MGEAGAAAPAGAGNVARTRLRFARVAEVVVVAGMLAFAAGFLWVPRPLGDLRHDCAIYTAQSYALARGEGSALPAGGLLLPAFYPPGYPLAIAVVHRLIGFDVKNGVVASHALSLLTLLSLYLLARRVAGPLAGAAALLFLLGNEPFGDMAHRILSQPLTLLGCTLAAHMAIETPRARWGLATGVAGGVAAGLAAGLPVFAHNTNVILAASIALFAAIVTLARRPRPWGWLAGVLAGIAAAACLDMIYLGRHYGSPWLTGYTAWHFPLDRNFSLDYLLHPPFPKDLPRWFQLRSLVGLGDVLSLPLAGLWLGGSWLAWRRRRRDPNLARLALLAACVTGLLYGWFAVYYMRSTGYLMLALPLQVAVAACGLARAVGRSGEAGRAGVAGRAGSGGGRREGGQRRAERRRGGRSGGGPGGSRGGWRRGGVVLVGLLLLIPAWKHTFWARGERDYHPYPEVGRMAQAARVLEPDAVVIGVANPLVVERMLTDGTSRRYLYLPAIPQSEHFLAAARHVTGREDLGTASLVAWVGEELAAGHAVYLLLHSPVKIEAVRPALTLTRALHARYRILPGPVAGYLRVASREE